MKIKEGFILRKIANADMAIPIGNNIANFNGIVSLNESAAFLWKYLKEGSDASRMIEALIEEYEIDAETAREDVEHFIKMLQDADILDEAGEGEL